MTQPNTIRYLFAAITALLGSLILYVCLFTGVPPREDLSPASGSVAWVEDRKHEVIFSLEGDSRTFTYLKKAGSKSDVVNTLRHDGGILSILFDPQDSVQGSLIVYEIEASARMIRSHGDVQSSWESNHRIGVWFGALFCVLSALLVFKPLIDRAEQAPAT